MFAAGCRRGLQKYAPIEVEEEDCERDEVVVEEGRGAISRELAEIPP